MDWRDIMYTYKMKEKTRDVQGAQYMADRTAGLRTSGIPNSVMWNADRSDPQEQGSSTDVTGLEQTMRTRFASHFGAISGVQIHYNSDLPERVDAEAYTQGDHIYLGPGQERHLPHELGHVVQQRRGGVTANERIGGMAANTDIRLEHEADVIGRQFEGMLPVSKDGLSSLGLISDASAPNSSAPVQMAGHSGVMVFSDDGTALYKRIEQNEYDSYRRIKGEQDGIIGDEEMAARAQNAFPYVHEIGEIRSIRRRVAPDGYNEDKFMAWIRDDNPPYYVEMESLGGGGVRIWDFKIGKQTALAEELQQNNHLNNDNAIAKKVRKMDLVDRLTESANFGLRDSDEAHSFSSKIRGGASYIFSCCGVKWPINTLDAIRRQVRERKDNGDDFSPLFQDLENIKKYIENTDTVYIGSSVIIKFPDDQNVPMARLIDLAHPVNRDRFPIDFESIRYGMLLGIKNLVTILDNPDADLSTTLNGGMPQDQPALPN